MATIFSIASQKGGVGKTTTTLNLGLAFSRDGLRTLIIDADPQGGIIYSLDRHYDLNRHSDSQKQGLYQVFSGQMEIHDAAQATNIPNLSVVDCGLSNTHVELEAYEDATRATGLFRESVRNASEYFDVILIDCPPGIGLVATGALIASDFVIIPVQSEPLSLRTLPQLLRQLIAVKKENNTGLEIAGILLTMVDSKNSASELVAQQMRECFETGLIFQVEIPRDPEINLLYSGHENVSEVLPEIEERSPGIRAYRLLAREVSSKCLKAEPVIHEKAW